MPEQMRPDNEHLPIQPFDDQRCPSRMIQLMSRSALKTEHIAAMLVPGTNDSWYQSSNIYTRGPRCVASLRSVYISRYVKISATCECPRIKYWLQTHMHQKISGIELLVNTKLVIRKISSISIKLFKMELNNSNSESGFQIHVDKESARFFIVHLAAEMHCP